MEDLNSQNMQSIDLVIPMVFPTDPEWQAAYAAASGVPSDAVRNVRYRSWGTEELLIKCCMKYMPWVRFIHLLLASPTQVQSWMEQLIMDNGKLTINEEDRTVAKNNYQLSIVNCQLARPQVKLVFHDQFIPKELLPCFNVNTIEMFLHRIPDLSEYFIYGNDDMFPLSPLEERDFFRASLPCQHMTEQPFPTRPNIFQKFVKGGLDMVATDWGRTFPGTWLRGGHSLAPMLRSTVEKVYQRHRLTIDRSFTFKRAGCNFNQYIFSFWQHMSGKYIDYMPPHRYLGPGTFTQDIAAIIRNPKAGVICINDNEKIRDWERRAEIVRREIEAKLTINNGNVNVNDNFQPSDIKHQ